MRLRHQGAGDLRPVLPIRTAPRCHRLAGPSSIQGLDQGEDTGVITSPAGARAVLSLNGAAVLVLGVLPGGLMAMCAYAIKALAT